MREFCGVAHITYAFHDLNDASRSWIAYFTPVFLFFLLTKAIFGRQPSSLSFDRMMVIT